MPFNGKRLLWLIVFSLDIFRMVQKKCGYKHRWYKFLRLQLRFLQKTEFITHLTAKTARGVTAHGVVVGYAVRG